MSLCKLISQRKSKVGCCQSKSEENSTDVIITGDTSYSAARLNNYGLQDVMQQDEPRVTRLSLCCAMTEGSRTPRQQEQVVLSDEDDDAVVVHTRDTGSQTTGTPDKRTIISPENSVVEMYEGIIKNTSRRSLYGQASSQRQVRSSGSSTPNSPVKFVDEGSDESPTYDSQSVRRTLPQRLSADNLLASPTSSGRPSSPDSVKSAPEVTDRKRSVSRDDTSQTEDDADGLASMDSLARQSLLAAQVLHLIPTDKARQRNFLHGRIALNSLLGPLELERVFPTREVTVFVGSWNMNGQAPPHELNDFMLPECLAHVPDIIAVGTQESYSERFEWEVKVQETVGPSHVLFHSTTFGTIHLVIYMRRDLIWFASVVEESCISVRPGMAFRTKGAAAAGFILFGTSYLFVTSHLTAHQEKIKERVHDVKKIVRSLDLPKVLPVRHRINKKDATQNFDCVFWFGDLNFRLSETREDVMLWVEETKFSSSSPSVNLGSDQLTKLITEGTCLSSFEEGPITFPPTYKYDPGTTVFDTSSKHRAPAYTDRILFKGKGTHIDCIDYSSVMSIVTSDHKPVWGVYKNSIRPGVDTLPLSAGLFNRDVYLEGIKRRAAYMSRKEVGLSAVCNLQ